jgi:hypothetical protein
MPWFRFIGEDGARVTLRFRNGACELRFANLGEADGWAWVAQRVKKPAAQIVLVRRGNMMALRSALTFQGFAVEAGSAAERIMRAAVKCGHAEELPDDERWRLELIRARAGRR